MAFYINFQIVPVFHYSTNRVVAIYDRHGEQRDEINLPGSVVIIILSPSLPYYLQLHIAVL